MFFIRPVQKELYDEIGRSLNFTCGSTCTYPVLGMGALLAYSLLQRVNLGQDNQLSRIGQNFAARTGLDQLNERMSSVHTEGIWLVGYYTVAVQRRMGGGPSRDWGVRPLRRVSHRRNEQETLPPSWRKLNILRHS